MAITVPAAFAWGIVSVEESRAPRRDIEDEANNAVAQRAGTHLGSRERFLMEPACVILSGQLRACLPHVLESPGRVTDVDPGNSIGQNRDTETESPREVD